ncbi:signal peptide, CUB and EGF-like domain-containing protein 1 [Lineus longissimus]|uniref:signal peptide, CUB and EGF-like domain-containing protein 1 n=1 Tax=Lineus longissimus TaxID=88925 RepID=UPI002B4F2094
MTTLKDITMANVLTIGIFVINAFFVTLTNSQGYIQPNGRHVCLQPTKRLVNVKTMQSYCKPDYRRVVQKCRSGYGMCSSFRVVYRTAYREVYRTHETTEMKYGCCNGWSKFSPHDRSCLKPICPSGCQNGGRCVSPGRCQCADGWNGRDCRTDLNECTSDRHGCMQKCENTIGSYRCSCYEGFNLDYDRKKCKLCLNCIKEYQQLIHSHTALMGKMDVLEKEKEQLERNVTNVLLSYQFAMENTANRYTEALRDVKEIQRESIEKKISQLLRSYRVTNKPLKDPFLDIQSGTTPPKRGDVPVAASLTHYEPDPYVEERLTSLNDQIGLLEERLASCSCDRGRRGK